MTITLNGTNGVTTPGVVNSAGETIATTLAVAGAATAGSLQVGGVATNVYPIVSGTVNAGGTNPFPSSSGPTSVDFESIPSWVKRITVIFSGVSTNGTSNPLIQIGSGSVQTTGYLAGSRQGDTTQSNYTTGFGMNSLAAANLIYGHMVLTILSGNSWVASHSIYFNQAGVAFALVGGGSVTLSGTLDRVRVTTVIGSQTFDAGSINILYE